MQTINSGNRKFYVIYFIYFSSVETDIIFLLVFSLLGSWLFINWGEEAFSWGIIIKIFIGFGASFSDKGAVQSIKYEVNFDFKLEYS